MFKARLGAAVLLAGVVMLGGSGAAMADPEPIAGENAQLVGSVGAPLVNVNIPCPAPWAQGEVAGEAYNACNTAPIWG